MQVLDFKVSPEQATKEQEVKKIAAKKLRIPLNQISDFRILKRSIDARQKNVKIQLRVALYTDGKTEEIRPRWSDKFQDVSNAEEVIIIGAGPAGYFAALELLELGKKPIVLERGKDVRERRKDLRAIQQFGTVNPHSNYCFGEGGAGTYSDGKLYTRSHKRGNIIKPLELLVEHGATPDILVEARPHIGSNKLPKIIANIRESILKHGGEVHFNSHVTDIKIENNQVTGVVINDESFLKGQHVILATGHSARDIFFLLKDKDVKMEAKPFALGVRIEHPQPLIDEIQYNQSPRSEFLPAASYKLTCHVNENPIFSFCMCPGGLVVPASTAPGEVVVNGMSLSRRDSPYANSGTVVGVEPSELLQFQQHGEFAGLYFQQSVEQTMYNLAGDGTQKAPGQRLTDFVNGKISSDLPKTSYIPGLVSAPIHELLPTRIAKNLQAAAKLFDRKMKGYYTAEANVIATESRTSSPIKIPRDKATLLHPQVKGLYPCGEGAGYAGGILSAAVDGQNVARAVLANY